MSDLRNAVRSARSAASTVGSRAVDVATVVAVVGGLTLWSLFWANLARVHYSMGDLVSALFTSAVFVAPAVAGLAWYVGDKFGVDALSPSVGGDVLSS